MTQTNGTNGGGRSSNQQDRSKRREGAKGFFGASQALEAGRKHWRPVGAGADSKWVAQRSMRIYKSQLVAERPMSDVRTERAERRDKS